MSDFINNLEILRRLEPDARARPLGYLSKHDELTKELQKYLHVLGPRPKRSLETFADLGLTDPEIARYFKIPTAVVTDFRQIWKIGAGT